MGNNDPLFYLPVRRGFTRSYRHRMVEKDVDREILRKFIDAANRQLTTVHGENVDPAAFLKEEDMTYRSFPRQLIMPSGSQDRLDR